MMNFSVDNMIGLSAGASMCLLSFSGMKCINSPCDSSKACSKANMNLGLSSLGVTGALVIYKYLRL